MGVERNNSQFVITIAVKDQVNITSSTDLQAYFANLFPPVPTWLQGMVGTDL